MGIHQTFCVHSDNRKTYTPIFSNTCRSAHNAYGTVKLMLNISQQTLNGTIKLMLISSRQFQKKHNYHNRSEEGMNHVPLWGLRKSSSSSSSRRLTPACTRCRVPISAMFVRTRNWTALVSGGGDALGQQRTRGPRRASGRSPDPSPASA